MDKKFAEINFHLTNKNEGAVRYATLDDGSAHLYLHAGILAVLYIHIKMERPVLSFPFVSKQGASDRNVVNLDILGVELSFMYLNYYTYRIKTEALIFYVKFTIAGTAIKLKWILKGTGWKLWTGLEGNEYLSSVKVRRVPY
jgi:hypothetical protein